MGRLLAWADKHPVASVVTLSLLFLLILVSADVVKSKFEADAYNRATGSSVSTWDALWIELRVQASPKENR